VGGYSAFPDHLAGFKGPLSSRKGQRRWSMEGTEGEDSLHYHQFLDPPVRTVITYSYSAYYYITTYN